MRVQFPVDDAKGEGYLALPPGEYGRGVLVLHAWWGLNSFIEGLCDWLASEGFVAFAPDLFGGRIATTREEAETLSQSAAFEGVQKQVRAATRFLSDHQAVTSHELGVLGISFGATFALWLSGELPEHIAATVVFYGTAWYEGKAYYDSARTRSAYLGHFAENDDFEPAENVRGQRDSLVTAGRDVTFYTYPATGHWFFESDVPSAYNAAAADLARTRTLAFLRRHLKTHVI